MVDLYRAPYRAGGKLGDRMISQALQAFIASWGTVLCGSFLDYSMHRHLRACGLLRVHAKDHHVNRDG